MIEFISSEDFRFLWLPIITTVLTIVIKLIYKDRRLSTITWGDFSVAPNLMITALFILLIKISLYASQLKNSPELTGTGMDLLFNKSILLMLMALGIMATMWIIREKGWKQDVLGQFSLKKTAIVISDIVGAFYIIIAYNF